MPPKKARKKDTKESASAPADEDSAVSALRRQGVRSKDFVSAELYLRFERHVRNAQDAYLRGDNALAEKEATAALTIKPTPSIFALLSVVAESKGQFDRASDFRLLQAFLAHDAVLWEELLHDFLSQQLYYKSVVCLQRMSALEEDPARYRTLQFQLVDLLVGLGEIRRATHILVPLWNSSKCRDFEVFALLSSLYFQLGKWSSLHRLIASSLKNSFHIRLTPAAVAEANRAEAERDADGDTKPQARSSKRVSKRVRFFGLDGGKDDDGEEKNATAPDEKAEGNASSDIAPMPSDEFSFDNLEPSTRRTAEPALRPIAEVTAANTVVRGMYGDAIELHTPAQKRNFLTLVNVHAELLNEGGKFDETVQLMEFTASALRVELLDLPPDLLVRLATAHAFLGSPQSAQLCREVIHSLVDTCSMEEYGDVLLDAAHVLAKVGMHEEAHHVFEAFAQHYQLGYTRITKELAEAKDAVEAAGRAAAPPSSAATARRSRAGGASAASALDKTMSLAAAERLRLAQQRLAELETEHEEVKTVLAAAYYGAANSLFSLRRLDEAEREGARALEADPTHLHARLLMGKIYFYCRHQVRAAVEVLTPREGEPALQRIQLGASLVRVFFKANMYIEAIALGVSLFEIILASSEDGDTESVAPGSSRRSAAPLLMPTMSRASSAILPASTLAAGGGGTAATGSVGRLSASLAASIRSGTSVYRQEFTRRGRAALTTTVYGASAAASVAAGWGREEEEALTKDSSTIFRFHRKRARRTGTPKEPEETSTSPPPTSAVKDEEKVNEGREEAEVPLAQDKDAAADAVTLAEEVARRREERREAIATMDAKAFWESPGDDKPKDESDDGKGNGEEDKVAGERAKGDESTGATDTAAPEAKTDRHRKPSAVAGLGNATTAGEKDRSLAELEGFEAALQSSAAAGTDDDAPAPDSYELPSLEEVSKRFDDPAMAQLFLEASANLPRTDHVAEEVTGTAGDGVGVGTSHLAAGSGGLGTDKVTLREAITALGRMEFMHLTVTVVDSYSAIGRFTEAKEFAFLALSRIAGRRYFRQMGSALERPLRLALLQAAMAAGHSEDAFRVGLRLLQDDQSVEQRNEVIELMHGVLNRCEDRTAILYRVFTDGACDVPLLVLLANRYHQTRSYTRVLNLYLCALQERPADVLLNFMVGLCYLFVSHQKGVKPHEALVSAGVYYLSQYQSLLVAVDASRTGEALYNAARALHFLRLFHLCVPLYQRIAQDLVVPETCSLAVQRAARVNLYYIYTAESENRALALTVLPHVACANPREKEERGSVP